MYLSPIIRTDASNLQFTFRPVSSRALHVAVGVCPALDTVAVRTFVFGVEKNVGEPDTNGGGCTHTTHPHEKYPQIPEYWSWVEVWSVYKHCSRAFLMAVFEVRLKQLSCLSTRVHN